MQVERLGVFPQVNAVGFRFAPGSLRPRNRADLFQSRPEPQKIPLSFPSLARDVFQTPSVRCATPQIRGLAPMPRPRAATKTSPRLRLRRDCLRPSGIPRDASFKALSHDARNLFQHWQHTETEEFKEQSKKLAQLRFCVARTGDRLLPVPKPPEACQLAHSSPDRGVFSVPSLAQT
jgi:hypothetical protein